MSDIFDLHMHTSQSDGCLSFEQLVTYMQGLGVKVMAITDHDVVTDISSHDALTDKKSISLISGVEITTAWNSSSQIHIVGLNVQNGSAGLSKLLKYNRDIRQTRAELIDHSLEKLGHPGALKYIIEKYSPNSLGRVHFARFLCDLGYVNNIGEAFKTILRNVVVGHKFAWPSLAEVIEAVHGAGGCAIIAHPLKYGFTIKELKQLVKIFSQLHGDGIEFISGNMTYKEMQLVSELSKPYNLLASMGSDFHAPQMKRVFNAAKYSKWLSDFTPVWSKWSKSK